LYLPITSNDGAFLASRISGNYPACTVKIKKAVKFCCTGVYTVSHIAGDSCVTAETEQEVLVLLPPDAGFDYDLTQCTGPFVVEAEVDADLAGNTYVWLFDGNSPQTTATATHTFYTPGEHKIKLTVTNACGTDAEEITFNIEDCTGTEACVCDSTNTIGEEGVTTKVSEAIEDSLLLPLIQANTTPQQVCIAGKLQLDQPYNFVNSTQRMLPGASIEVTDGITFGIVNSFLHGCDEMWRGIEVEDGGRLNMTQNTNLADAQYGVYLYPGASGSIARSRFFRNYISLYYAPGALSLDCHQNTFLGGVLKAEFSGQSSEPEDLPEIEINTPLAGIWADGVPLLGVGKCYFEGMSVGVGARKSNMTFRNNRFVNIVNEAVYQPDSSWSTSLEAAFPNGLAGYGILAFGQANTISIAGFAIGENAVIAFDHCTSGIDLTGYSGRITGNRMSNTPTSIVARMVNVGGLEIYQNRIEDAQYGIGILESEPLGLVKLLSNIVTSLDTTANCTGIQVAQSNVTGQRLVLEKNRVNLNSGGLGIHLLNTTGAKIINDTINLNNGDASANAVLIQGGSENLISGNWVIGQDAGNTGHFGISTVNSIGNAYCCNTTDSTGTGFYFQGACKSENKIKGNMMENHNVGLLLATVQDTSNVTQIGLQSHQGNQWNGTYGSGSGAIYGQPSAAFLSLFFVDVQQNSAFMPINPIPSSGWFINASGMTDTCSTESCESHLPLTENEDTKRIAENGYTNVVDWTLSKYAYRDLKDAALADSVLVAFITDSEGSPRGQIPVFRR